MATVPEPQHDRPLPTPGAPAEAPVQEPAYDPDQERRAAPGPDTGPEWADEPAPWSPERERIEPDVPAGVP